MMRHREFDASEMSWSGYTIRRSRGLDDFVAIPVFLSRSFRHSAVYINPRSGIEKPEDLQGGRIGMPEYQMTAAVWARGMLEDDYGVKVDEARWIQGGLEQPGRKPFEPVQPEGISLEFAPEGRTLGQMLVDGELDALISPRVPSVYESGAATRLFENPWEAERDYYDRTGIFPIMHTVAIKREIVDAHPWIPQTLSRAFLEAKQDADIQLRDTTVLTTGLPFLVQHVQETAALMGEDFWPYGVEPNRPTIEAFLRYAGRQGLLASAIDIDDLFPASTRTTSKV